MPALPAAQQALHIYMAEWRLDGAVSRAVEAISLGVTVEALRQEVPDTAILEEIEYQARRLAKLQVEPARLHQLLSHYDAVLLREIDQHQPQARSTVRMVVGHYHLFITNVINMALYQLWRSDSRLLEELSALELANDSVGNLRKRIIRMLREWSGADAACIRLQDLPLSISYDAPFPVRSGHALLPPWRLGSATGHAADAVGLPADHAGGQGADAGAPPSPPLLRTAPADLPVCVLLRAANTASCDAAVEVLLNARWRHRFAAVWSLPIQAGSHLSGALQLGFRKPMEWLPSERALLGQVCERLGLALTRCLLVTGIAAREAQVRQLATHLQVVEERERKRISQELHDEAGQSLLYLRLQLEMLEKSLPDEQSSLRGSLQAAREQVESIIVEIRRLLAALSPKVIEQFGLSAAIRHQLKEFLKVFPVKVDLDNQLPEGVVVSDAASMVIYRFVQECLHNILSHSQADTVKIRSAIADGFLVWQVTDNGVGFVLDEAQRRQGSLGLRGIRERIFLMGGTVRIDTAPGQGTVVTATLPLSADAASHAYPHAAVFDAIRTSSAETTGRSSRAKTAQKRTYKAEQK